MDDNELNDFTDLALSILPVNDLLGRTRIRQRWLKLGGQPSAGRPGSSADFSEQLVACFDEAGAPLITPTRALSYFRGLTPTLGVDPQRWGRTMQRHAFTMAVATDEAMLAKVQDVIAQRLETGQGVSTAPRDINAILSESGIVAPNRGYAEMVWRTNARDAYLQGQQEEILDPDVADYFPAWKYVGVGDERERDTHEFMNDSYWPREVLFADVRDNLKGSYDGYNCRCDMIPLDKFEWAYLQKQGKKFATAA
jgi:hypothetical protein